MGKTKNDKLEEKNREDIAAVNRILLDGDSSAFKFIQNKYQKIIASLIRRMIKDEDDVDDLTQETFIKTYNALHTFQQNYTFSSWIYRIASNTCIDYLRKKRFPTISINQPLDSSEDDYFFEIEDNSYLPDDNILSEEKMKVLNDAINKLPENYREIIKLRHEEELDYNEISIKMNIPLGTVKAHLFRARKILMISLKKHAHLFKND